MTDRTATHDCDRLNIEQAADFTPMPLQQICEWAIAHKLDAHRVCTGFRLDELGLADLVSAPDSGRSRTQCRGDGSRPTFAMA
jgi:hypothetical protein